MRSPRLKSKFKSWTLVAVLSWSIVFFGFGAFIFKLTVHASALSFVCASSAAATSTAACAGEQAGDLLLVTAGKTASGTIPTLASGFTSIGTDSVNSGPGASRIALISGWATAANSSSGSGTWTNASDVVMQVYRGQSASPIGNNSPTDGSATSVTYNTDTLSAADGSSWFAAFAVRDATDSVLTTAPSGMINRTSTPASPEAAGYDTNGPVSSNWPTTSVSGFGASTRFASIVIEIKAAPSIIVNRSGSLVANLTIPSTSDYVGGAFTFRRDAGSADVTSITIHNSGTVNALANILNLTLFYKQEAVCSTSIPAGVTQFNASGVGFNFSGDATATGTMPVSASQTCVYVQVDVGSGASAGDTLALQITNPSTDVVASAGTVSPTSPVVISGSIILAPPGPTTDQVLRGGEWFSGGVKQPFFWAN